MTRYVSSSISLKCTKTFFGDHVVAKRSLGTTIIKDDVFVSVQQVNFDPRHMIFCQIYADTIAN